MALKPARLQWSDDNTLRSLDFEDVYFQSGCGLEEKHYVFLEQNRLAERFAALSEDSFRIAELGFGTGLNFLLTAQLWKKTAPPDARLVYVSIEKHPIPKADLARVFSFWPSLKAEADVLLAQYPPLVEGFHHLYFLKERIHLVLLFGDVSGKLPELQGEFDVWYLDGFTPSRNPAMWTEELFPLVSRRTRAGGTLATFSCAGFVRRHLQAAGFATKKIKGFGVKWSMTVAQKEGTAPALISRKKNITVLGAGLAGASTAFALAQKGYAVTVMDRQPAAAQETSGNPIGIAYPKMTVGASPFGEFYQQGFCYTRNLAQTLALSSWNSCGVTHLDISPEKEKRHRTLSAQGYPEEYLRYEAGLHFPLAGFLSPPELCRRLLDHPNIRTLYNQNISTLEEIRVEALVIALSHSSKNFKETAWLPLQSLRGQITFLTPTPQSEKLAHVYCHDGFITPVVNGLHYIGATFQREEPAAPQLRPADHHENLQKLNRYMPELGLSETHIAGGRAGYRTTTPDKLPMIGLCPDHAAFITGKKKYFENIYLATGFGAHGLTAAPFAGEMIAAMIAGDPLPLSAELMDYLAPERFILRDLKRGKI